MFIDRKDGGEKLAHALIKYRDQDVLVLGIPRGGVETAYYVATYLHAEFSLVVTRKLGYPSNPEAAFGALAEDGSLFLFEESKGTLETETLQSVVQKEKIEIIRRIGALRHGKPLPRIQGRTVILIDDGIATGATLFASIKLCKKQKAGKIIAASPVAGEQMKAVLQKEVDEVVILLQPPLYYAVSQGYQYFDNLTDKQVLTIMHQWEQETHSKSR